MTESLHKTVAVNDWLRAMAEDGYEGRRLTGSQADLLRVMAWDARDGDTAGRGHGDMAKRMRTTARNVSRIARQLMALGVIEYLGGGSGEKPTRYRLHVPATKTWWDDKERRQHWALVDPATEAARVGGPTPGSRTPAPAQEDTPAQESRTGGPAATFHGVDNTGRGPAQGVHHVNTSQRVSAEKDPAPTSTPGGVSGAGTPRPEVEQAPLGAVATLLRPIPGKATLDQLVNMSGIFQQNGETPEDADRRAMAVAAATTAPVRGDGKGLALADVRKHGARRPAKAPKTQAEVMQLLARELQAPCIQRPGAFEGDTWVDYDINASEVKVHLQVCDDDSIALGLSFTPPSWPGVQPPFRQFDALAQDLAALGYADPTRSSEWDTELFYFNFYASCPTPAQTLAAARRILQELNR